MRKKKIFSDENDEGGGRKTKKNFFFFTFFIIINFRPRRRSGSSLVVVDDEPLKHSPIEEQDDAYNMMMTMLDNGPHRELPVDVPDSFIAISKTPPRYPPPRTQVNKKGLPQNLK